MGSRLLKSIIIVLCTVAGITALAFFMYKPPFFFDAITGASKRIVHTADEALEGSYIFVMNKEAKAFKDEKNRAIVKTAVMENGVLDGFSQVDLSFSLSVSEDDPALKNYAKGLCERLSASGINAKLSSYSKTMLRSRIAADKYEAFLTTRGFTDAEAVKHSDFVMLASEQMEGSVK